MSQPRILIARREHNGIALLDRERGMKFLVDKETDKVGSQIKRGGTVPKSLAKKFGLGSKTVSWIELP